MALDKKWVDELTKLSLQANSSIQDIKICSADVTREDIKECISVSRKCLASFRDKIEELERQAKLSDKETQQVALEEVATKYRQDLNRFYTDLRKAHLASMASIEKREKESLIGQDQFTSVRQRNTKDKEGIAKASSTITDSLVNVSRMMSDQLQKGSHTIETLANSSNAITTTNEELRNMKGHIKNARTLLTKFDRREITDRLFIFLSLVFFFATVVYIMKKRLWSSVSYPETSST